METDNGQRENTEIDQNEEKTEIRWNTNTARNYDRTVNKQHNNKAEERQMKTEGK